MPLYLVSYDIAQRNEEDYQPLWDLLKKRNAARILYSQWIVVGSGFHPEKELFDAISPLLHDGDGLLISEITQLGR